MIDALRRRLAAAVFLLRTGTPLPMMWRVMRGRRRVAAVSTQRAAEERFVASLADARLTQTWFLRHVPTWLDVFARQGLVGRTGLRVLEIGSWEGLSCRFILDQFPGAVVTCVDTWAGADEHRVPTTTTSDALEQLESRFDHNTRMYGERVVKWKGTSQAYFAAREPQQCFDLVYVDGSHRADDVLVDAIRGFEALTEGGVMIFDDYLWKHYDRPQDNPGAAINAFLQFKRGLHDVIHAGNQVAIIKRRGPRDRAVLTGGVIPVVATIAALLSGVAARAVRAAEDGPAAAAAAVAWHDVATWELEGRLWTDEERLRHFDRFPAAARETVPEPVWNLSRDSAGMVARFRTDAPAIRVRMKVSKPQLAMSHMPATGVSGLDLYARDPAGRWRWVTVTRPAEQEFEAELISGLAPGSREYAAYLPLYNGVESLEIGVPTGAAFEPLPARARPIVFYGTSITHGACASRPGLAHVAILGRRLDRPVANLGFSGNGRMDAAVGDLLARVDASCYVIDCLPNMSAEQVRERCVPLVDRLRAARPEVPIVLVEDRRMANAWILPATDRLHDERHAALRAAFDALGARGVAGIHYIPGDDLLGADSEGTVDASHPNDLGFMRQADAFEPVLRRALQVDMPRATSGAK